MKKILIPILLLPLAFTSCKKHQIKKQTKQVAGTFRGQMERYYQESHRDSLSLIIDTAYNSVNEIAITIEKKDDDQIFVTYGNGSGTLLKYAGHNMQSTYGVWDKFGSRYDTIVYYPSKDSLFIVGRRSGSSGKPPWNASFENYYFKGKRVSD